MSAVPGRSQGPGRPKDMGKRAAILEAAQGLFIRNAFAGTSMDAVAAEAGVSKLTVYSHFGDKDNLFREVVRAHIQDLLPESTYGFDPALPIEQTLLHIALAHGRIECAVDTLGTMRAILGDCRQGNPRYGRLLWEEATGRKYGLIGKLLQRGVDARLLDIDNVARASVQFFSLAMGDLKLRRMFGCDGCPQAFAGEVEATARDGVATFMRAYGAR